MAVKYVRSSGSTEVTQSDGSQLQAQVELIGDDVFSKYTTSPINITASQAANRNSVVLSVGLYEITLTTDGSVGYFLQGNNTVTADTADHIIHNSTYRLLRVDDVDTEGYISVILPTGESGTLCISKLG